MPYVALVKMLDSLFFASLNTFDIVVNNQETLISESFILPIRSWQMNMISIWF